jgi:hypothetical protein
MFRSTSFKHYNLISHREYAWQLVSGLGRLGCLQVVDYDADLPLSARAFSDQLKRCESFLQLIGEYSSSRESKRKSKGDTSVLKYFDVANFV